MDKPRPDYQLRVQYYHTDQMGVVHHAVYFQWMESARTEWLRECGISYHELETKGFMLPLASASCEYKAPATYDSLINVYCSVRRLKRSTLEIEYILRKAADNTLIATGHTRHACIDSESRRIVPFPHFLHTAIRASNPENDTQEQGQGQGKST